MPRQDLFPLRRGTKAAWETTNPTLAEGEPGFETDTYTLKVGDGNTPYTTLPALNMGIQYYNAQVNGFEISKDNDDVERKFSNEILNFIDTPDFSIVGIEWDSSNSSPTLKYIDSAGSEISKPDFDTLFVWGNIWRCNYYPSTGEIVYGNNARGDGLILTDSTIPVLVRIPCFYVKVETDGSLRRWYFSPTPQTGFVAHYWFHQRGGGITPEIFIGAYEASGYAENGVFKLTSCSGKQPVTGGISYTDLPNSGRFTMDDAETYAQAGSFSGIEDFWGYAAIQLLMYGEYGTFDIQTALGKGVVDLASGTGFAGVYTGANSSDSNIGTNGTGSGTGINGQTPIVWRGIENPYGNVWEFSIGANFYFSGGTYRILKRDGTGTPAANLAAGSYETGSGVVPLADGYISGFLAGDLEDFAFLPSAAAGSSSTYACDWWANPRHNPSILLAGGSWTSKTSAGPGCRDAYNAPSISARSFGARVEMRYQPTVSYADSFTADTVTTRYAPVEGTLAYDDVNDRMSMTAAAGASAKARLKSYKHVSGNYKVKMTLPTTATDGDACIHYLATQGDCSTGYGAGVIRTGGVWNIATADGTTITDTGTAVAGLVDGDSFYVELLRDVEHGVTWYYVYESAKPVAASGKLFNTYQEGYSAYWYKNIGASEVVVYVDDIEIRAESIVDRTNVPVEEPFWFRDEFGDANSLNRTVAVSGTSTITGGKLVRAAVNTSIHRWTQMLTNPTLSGTVNIASGGNEYLIWGWDGTTNMVLPTNAMYIRVAENSIKLYSQTAATATELAASTPTLAAATDYDVVVTVSDSSVIVTLDTVEVINYTGAQTYTQGYVGVLQTGNGTSLDDFEVSGTRVYNKPIHRGAQIGEYEE